MKISIITPTYNSAKTIEDTIQSIVVQNYPDLEYIIIDGGSTDNTKEIIFNYQNKIKIKYISEPDEGIYDAMNKGIKIATGDIIGILNSDDLYYDKNILQNIDNIFKSDKAIDAVYGDLIYVDRKDINKKTRYWKAGEYNENKLNWGWIIPHPTFFVKKEIYEKKEKIFNTSFSIAGDYELILRLLKINKIRVKYIPEILIRMRNQGTSGNSLKQRIKGWKEIRKAWKINNLKIPKFFILKRITKKISQFLH
jgi:glycosyltransferase involved in cell wall biosynthesis